MATEYRTFNADITLGKVVQDEWMDSFDGEETFWGYLADTVIDFTSWRTGARTEWKAITESSPL